MNIEDLDAVLIAFIAQSSAELTGQSLESSWHYSNKSTVSEIDNFSLNENHSVTIHFKSKVINHVKNIPLHTFIDLVKNKTATFNEYTYTIKSE